MRVSREKMNESRERVLDAAAELFRVRGLDGISVAEIMDAAGLTHGGFYRHFDSKDDLATQACSRAFEQAIGRLVSRRGNLTRYTDNYLSERHRDDPGQGCPIACFAAEIGDSANSVQATYVDGLTRYFELLAERMPRERAIALMSTLVGALLLARATFTQSPRLSSEILAAARHALAAGDPDGQDATTE